MATKKTNKAPPKKPEAVEPEVMPAVKKENPYIAKAKISAPMQLQKFSAYCDHCHTDMYPYDELPENIKEYDRVTVRAVLQAMDELGIKLLEG